LLLSQRQLEAISAELPHLAKYRPWIDEQVHLTVNPNWIHIVTGKVASMVKSWAGSLSSTPVSSAAQALYKVSTSTDFVFSDGVEAFDLLHQGDLLNENQVLIKDASSHSSCVGCCTASPTYACLSRS
jgi:hypothetical protein